MHRDVSPQNVLVTCEGVVKIVDFGVAKATAADTGRTRAGQIKGKAPFMSPEQALGRVVDRRTDIFALGIVLYQMLAGRHPFRGETEMATLNRITDKEPAQTLTHNLRTAVVDPKGRLVKILSGNEWTVDQLLADLRDASR